MQPLGAHRLDDEIDGARPHGRDHIVDAAMRGLHDDRHAEPGLAQARQHAEAVEARHHQVEDDGVERLTIVGREHGERGLATFSGERPIAEPRHHVLDQAPVHGIVIDDQDAFGHCGSVGEAAAGFPPDAFRRNPSRVGPGAPLSRRHVNAS